MTIKIFKHFIFTLLAACVLLPAVTSCSNDTDSEPLQTVDGLTITISPQSDLQTRTTLPSYDGEYGDSIKGIQHVTDVYLYIYEMNADNTDGVCKARFNVGWRDHFEEELPTATQSMTYQLSYTFVVGKTYRLVAIGVDGAESGEIMPDYDGMNSTFTYGLPTAVTVGSKLSAPVQLQNNMTTTDMAHSEFFTGYVEYKPQLAGDNQIETIHLWRRVAGVQVFLTDIPEEVERVRILLYNAQNTQVNIIPQLEEDYITSPFGGNPFNDGGRVLMDIPIEHSSGDSSSGIAGAPTYSMTAFMLPMGPPDREKYDYTLAAEFVTTSITGIVGTSKKIRLIKPGQNSDNLGLGEDTDIGTGIIDDLNQYLFPIEANHMYCLGTKSKPIICNKVLN